MSYLYDGEGKRLSKSNGKLYWYGLSSDALMETDSAGNNPTEYIFFGGKRIARRDSSGAVNYYFADHLGSSRVVTNATGTILDDSDFYPFGGERVVSSSSGNNYKFTGKERDTESNLDFFIARYYSSGYGRFLSPDEFTGGPMDVVRARFAGGVERVFIGAGGIGLDAEANQLATGRFRKLPGVVRYIAGALAALVGAEPLRVTAEFDEGRWEGEVLFAAVANAPTYGAGVAIAPEAKMDDGFLNLVLVGPLRWTRVLEAIPIVLRDGDLRWPEIRRVRTRRLTLRANRRAPFHGDGEILGEAPIEFEVLPGAVNVLAGG